MKSNITILTSKQNHVWVSMQEIVPKIESQWLSFNDKYNVTLINCDEKTPKEVLATLIKSDIIVMTVFNLSISKFAHYIRGIASIDTPWVLYLHNQATISMWPYYQWKMGEFFQENDLFIGTCDGDMKSLKLSLPKAQYLQASFPYEELPKGNTKNINKGSSSHSFVYVGRISAQKQLHNLIWAFSLLLKENPECNQDLHLFGKEDNLGSPNMGIPGEGYLIFLKELVKKLELEDKVHFQGFKKREDIHTSLKTWSHTLVFPSLHSDENFGMSLMRGLKEGSTAICSDWGGFNEHIKNFPSSVMPINVYQSETGPFISAEDLKLAMVKSSSLTSSDSTQIYRDEESLKDIESAIQMTLNNTKTTRLELSELGKEILKTKSTLEDRKEQRIFKDYKDKRSFHFFNAYGMNHSISKYSSQSQLAPWVEKKGDKFISSEPYKGELEFNSLEELFKNGFCV